MLNVVFECGTWEGCDVRSSSMRTSFPLLSHRLLHFVHGRHRLLDHPILRRAITPRQLSGACTLSVPANIRATTCPDDIEKSIAHRLHCAMPLSGNFAIQTPPILACIFSSAPFFSTGTPPSHIPRIWKTARILRTLAIIQ